MKVKVEFEGKKKFKMKIREHEMFSDLSAEKGGEDTSPTPPEIFIASLGSCMGYYALGYLTMAKMDASGLNIDLDWEFSDDGKRIAKIKAEISVPNAVLGERKRGLLAATEKCIIHKTLHDIPEMVTNIIGE
jgi:putative redox protein